MKKRLLLTYISMDATVAAVFSELDGDFAWKEKGKEQH